MEMVWLICPFSERNPSFIEFLKTGQKKDSHNFEIVFSGKGKDILSLRNLDMGFRVGRATDIQQIISFQRNV